MGLFGNQTTQGGPPVDSVQQLRSQGRSDHEIIDMLSRQGYSSIDIYNALNQADQSPSQPSQQPPPAQQPPAQAPEQNARDWSQQPAGQQNDPWGRTDAWNQSGGPAQQAPQAQQPQAQEPWPSDPSQVQTSQNEWSSQTPAQASSQPSPQFSPSMPNASEPAREFQPNTEQSIFSGPEVDVGSDKIDQLDQIAEAIIDEKWKQLKQYIEKIIDWKGKVESRIIAIEQNQKNLNEQIIGLQKSLVDKVQTYDRHITDVGTEIKAMEKVFQKIIPSLTENVNELSNVVHRMKDER